MNKIYFIDKGVYYDLAGISWNDNRAQDHGILKKIF